MRILIWLTILLWLAATSALAQSVTVDFSNTTVSNGLPATFGGNGSGPTQDPQLRAIGVTTMRISITPSQIVPNGGGQTLAQYQSALVAGCPGGSICDPGTWNWSVLDTQTNAAKALGMPVLGDFNGTWPPNSNNNTRFGVPLDYNVFEDIVKKEFQHNPQDFVEVWPEAELNGFSAQDYAQNLYFHTAHAIRSFNATVPIGGPGNLGENDTARIDAIHSFNPNNYVNFITWHHYKGGDYGIDTTEIDRARTYWPNIPAYVTEWGWDGSCNSPQGLDPFDSVGWQGAALISILQNGFGSFYFTMGSICCPGFGNNGSDCGFWQDPNNTILMNKAYVWRVFALDLGLNAGQYTVKSTAINGLANAVGAVNSAGKPVVALANWFTALNVTITLNNLANGNYNLQTFVADYSGITGASPTENMNVAVTNGTLVHKVHMTDYSSAGMILSGGGPPSTTTPTPAPTPAPTLDAGWWRAGCIHRSQRGRANVQATSLSISVPAGIQAGDLMEVFL